MSRPTILKLAFLVVGLVVFGYGVREDLAEARWTGIGFMAAGLVLRLATAKRSREPDPE